MNSHPVASQTGTRQRLRLYAPLLGFVVPTLVIGYGFVIPNSCIAGVNALSIGFGTTVLGAALTYIAGQRTAQTAACAEAPLGIRIARFINRQAACPHGAFGRVLGLLWPLEHGRLRTEVLNQLELRPGQHVLEIGFGTGHAVAAALARAKLGRVVGLEVSSLMYELARKLNRAAVQRGDIELRMGSVVTAELGAGAFDRIFAVHCIYFWGDPKPTLQTLARALRPGGTLLLAFRSEGETVPARFRDATYRFPTVDEVERSLSECERWQLTVTESQAERGVTLVRAERAASA